MSIKTGDEVTVIAGNDRGKTGKVLKSLPRENKVVVEGINLKSKHVKGEDGGIKRFEHPIHVSNVVLSSAVKKSTKAKTATKKADKETKAEDKKSETKKTKGSAEKKVEANTKEK